MNRYFWVTAHSHDGAIQITQKCLGVYYSFVYGEEHDRGYYPLGELGLLTPGMEHNKSALGIDVLAYEKRGK